MHFVPDVCIPGWCKWERG